MRAILRASAHGPVKIMIPMLTNIQEMQQVLQIVEDIKNDLDNESIDYDADIRIGGMIEVPAAAICGRHIRKKTRFSFHRYKRLNPIHHGNRSR